MTGSVPDLLARLMRADRGRLLARLIAQFRDFTLAEDALQDAAESALVHWQRAGVPASPEGWMLRVAGRKAVDRLRKARRMADHAAAMAVLAEGDAAAQEPEMIPDDRLRLIFTCCHPALDRKSQVALTLRMVGGLTTAEIAQGFLDEAATIGQRISRAKARIAAAGIPYAVPGPDDWPDRLQAVLAVIYLVFNAGYTDAATRGLCDEAVFLARLLNTLRPDEAEVEGCLALLLLTHARRRARVGPDGATVPPYQQDRALWDHAAMAEGLALLSRAMAREVPGPFQIKAAIAALHGAPGQTDWPAIATLHDRLMAHEPTPVVRLNRAVALAEAGQLPQALADLLALGPDLDQYQPYHAARAHVLCLAGQRDAAVAAYDRALAMAPTTADARFLHRRRLAAAAR